MEFKDLENITIEGINYNDIFDFADAFVAYAEYEGNELFDADYDMINDNYSDDIHNYIIEHQLYL